MPHTKKNHSASLSSPPSDPQKLGTKIKPVATKVSLFEDIPHTQASSLSQSFTSAKLLQDVKLAATARKVGSNVLEYVIIFIIFVKPISHILFTGGQYGG